MEAFSCLVCKYGSFAPPPNENNKLVIQFPFLIASFISCRINSATWESFKSKKTILKKKNYTSAPFSSFFPLLFLLHLGSLTHKFWAGLFRIDAIPKMNRRGWGSISLMYQWPVLLSFSPPFLFATFLEQFIGVSYFTSIWVEWSWGPWTCLGERALKFPF